MPEENKLQIERELEDFILKYKLGDKLTVAMVKDWVLNEEGSPMEAAHDFQDKFMRYFENIEVDLNEVLQVAMKAWNSLPHKSLGNKSPNEIINN